MPVSKVRADYEQLAQIAGVFGQQAETARQVFASLQSDLNTLQEGDWVGKGSEAFYAEMNAAVLPSMERLAAALNDAASTTQKVSQIMKQAEDDAAALFRLDDSAAGADTSGAGAPGNGALGGPEAGTASAFWHPGPDGGGGSSKRGSGKPAPVFDPNDPRFKRMPPGPGAYTEAEFDDWTRRHPRAVTEPIIGRQWKDEYTPEWLKSRGYYYSGPMWIGDPTVDVEIWISEKGDGKVITVARDATARIETLPDPLAEDLQEIQDSVVQMKAGRTSLLDRLRDVLQGKGKSGGENLNVLQERHIKALDEAIERAEELVDLATDSESPLAPEMAKSLGELYRLRNSLANDVLTTLRDARKTAP